MKNIILEIFNLISKLWLIIPQKLRVFVFIFFLILESRDEDPKNGLKRIFKIKDKIEWIINERALKAGNGIHLKHRLTKYHSFFIDNIKNGEKIIDIGCGYGAVARSIALAKNKSLIIGIDINEENIYQAKNFKNPQNLSFYLKDANTNKSKIKADVIVLSNVLEHIEERIIFLSNIRNFTDAYKILIRVPLFERDWQIPLRKELNIDYFSDKDHKIEHTLDEFEKELSLAKIKIDTVITKWGEIWASCYYE